MSELPTMRERKKMLRALMKEKLKVLPHGNYRELASISMEKTIVASPWWKEAGQVALFSSRQDEPETELLMAALWTEGRAILLPKVLGEDMAFYEVKDADHLQAGAFGLLEPDAMRCRQVPPSEIDLMFVPGLAFDRHGHRLGRGKGFFDRFLALPGFQGRKIGLFFSIQEIDKVPVEDHDWKMDFVLTELGWLHMER